MTETALPSPVGVGEEPAAPPRRRSAAGDTLLRSIGPVAAALVAGAILLVALGRNPLTFYADVLRGGLLDGFWQESVIRMAPLLLIAAGLVVVFKAGIWNLGIDGQLLLAATLAVGLGPGLEKRAPNTVTLVVLFLLAAAVAGVWTLVPALLKARYGLNEIITTLMMTFIGINVANILIKGPFQDFSSNVPQTGVLPFDAMLPTLPGTRIHVGILVALAAILVVWYLMTWTSFGLRLQILGASVRSAKHLGLNVPRLIVVSFAVSGVLMGLAGAAEFLGVWGYIRADQNPAFGLEVVPLVFLARLNALAVVPFVGFFAVLSIGGDLATREAELPNDFILVLVGLILLFMAVTEYLGRTRALGQSYLPAARRRARA